MGKLRVSSPSTAATTVANSAATAGKTTSSAFAKLKANVLALPAKTQEAFKAAVTVVKNNPKTSLAVAATVVAVAGYVLYTHYHAAPADGSDVA